MKQYTLEEIDKICLNMSKYFDGSTFDLVQMYCENVEPIVGLSVDEFFDDEINIKLFVNFLKKVNFKLTIRPMTFYSDRNFDWDKYVKEFLDNNLTKESYDKWLENRKETFGMFFDERFLKTL